MPGVVQLGRFEVSHSGSIVTITANASSAEDFDKLLGTADTLRSQFRRSQGGSDWGCDGVGYGIQKGILRVVVHRSGVGPRKFKEGLVRATELLERAGAL